MEYRRPGSISHLFRDSLSALGIAGNELRTQETASHFGLTFGWNSSIGILKHDLRIEALHGQKA